MLIVKGRRRPGVHVWFGRYPSGVPARCGGSGWPAGVAKQKNFRVLTVSATLPSAAP
jgi:hypothetical protein